MTVSGALAEAGFESRAARAAKAPPARSSTFPWIALSGVLLAVAGAIGRDLYVERESIWVKEREALDHRAEIVAARLGGRLQSAANGLEAIRQQLPQPPGSPAAVRSMDIRLRSMASAMAGVRSLLVVDADGAVIGSSRTETAGSRLRGLPTFEALAGRSDVDGLQVLPPFAAPGGETAVALMMAVHGAGARLEAGLIAVLDPRDLGEILHSVLYAPDMRAGIVHWDGTVVPPVIGDAGAVPEPVPEAGALLASHRGHGGPGSVLSGSAGPGTAERLVAFRTIRPDRSPLDRPLIVFVSREVPAVFAGWRKDLAERGLVFGALVAFSATGLYLRRRRQGASERLRHAAEAQRLADERRLRESEARWKFALEGAGHGVWDWDVASGRIVYSPRYAQMLGFRDGELGDDPEARFAAVHPDDRARARATCGPGCRERARACHAEFRMRCRDGSYRWFESRGMVVAWLPDGRPARMIGTQIDITERKRLEQAAKERGQLREALLKHQVASQTAAAIAHELNQPLVAISAYSEAALAMLRQDGHRVSNVERAVEGTFAQSQRAGEVLRTLLARLSRREAAGPEPFDLNVLANDCVDAVKQWAPPELDVALQLDPTLRPVLGSRLQTEKVIANLLTNAVEATQEARQGRDAIRIAVRSGTEEGRAFLAVRDFGPGIDAESAGRLFEAFYSTKRSGVGLGLAISRSLIEAQGGRLQVETDCVPGAEFRFTLPLADDGQDRIPR